jgi:hypothetical protein
LLPLRWLQAMQAVTRLSQVLPPPLLTGTTWSMVRSARLPQYLLGGGGVQYSTTEGGQVVRLMLRGIQCEMRGTTDMPNHLLPAVNTKKHTPSSPPSATYTSTPHTQHTPPSRCPCTQTHWQVWRSRSMMFLRLSATPPRSAGLT